MEDWERKILPSCYDLIKESASGLIRNYSDYNAIIVIGIVQEDDYARHYQ